MIPIIQQLADKLGQIPSVEKVILFGSRARGTHWERSDINLAVICPDASWGDWARMTDVIDEAPTLLKIDLVRFRHAPGSLQDEILIEGVPLYEREKEDQTLPA